jgi:hypothetical protein
MAVIDLKPKNVIVESKGNNDKHEKKPERLVCEPRQDQSDKEA